MAFYFKVKEVKQGDKIFTLDENLVVNDGVGEDFLNLKYFAFNKIKKEENNVLSNQYITVNYEDLEIYYQSEQFPLGAINMYLQIKFEYLFKSEYEYKNNSGWYRVAQTGDYIEFDAKNKPRIEVERVYSNLNNNALYAKFFGNTYIRFSYLTNPDDSDTKRTYIDGFVFPWGVDGGITSARLETYWGDNLSTEHPEYGIARTTYPFCIREEFYDDINSLQGLINVLNSDTCIGTNSLKGTKGNKVFTPITMHTTYAEDESDLGDNTNAVFTESQAPRYLEYARKIDYDNERLGKYQFDQYRFPNNGSYKEVLLYPITGVSSSGRYNKKWVDFFSGIDSVDEIPNGDGPESQPGGGNGNFDNNSDEIKSPTIPTVGALDTGFITSYKLGTNQMLDLRNVFWSKDFIDNVYKLFNDPSQALVSMQITYAPIETGVAQKMIIGNYETNITALKITKQYYVKDFGEINIKEYWGNFLDYSPNTQLSIYLPFIGIRGLDVNNFMDGNIGVKYYIDALTGACVAHITTKKGNAKDGYINSIIASYNGNCNIQIPWTSSNFLETQLKLVETGASVAVGAVAGISGIAPVTVAEATGLASATANSVIREHSHINQGGSMTSNTGILGIKYPYLILTRPKQSLPKNYSKYNGYPSNITSKLDGLSGFTKVMDIHLDNITASATDGVVYPTKAELDELESLLKQGIII